MKNKILMWTICIILSLFVGFGVVYFTAMILKFNTFSMLIFGFGLGLILRAISDHTVEHFAEKKDKSNE